MANQLFFDLRSIKPLESGPGGTLMTVTGKETPGLVNISFANLTLKKRGSLEPIWHPNAHKVGYCTQGRVIVTVRSPGAADAFTVKKGEMFFIPKGYIHHIENISEQDSVIQFALNHTAPETMNLNKAISSISDSVYNSTFNTVASFVDGLKKSKNNGLLKTLPPLNKIPGDITSEYKYDIEGSGKPILTKGGYVQLGTKGSFPILEGLGILGFGLNKKGIVEPHWHTNAGELVFIVKGKTRITVLSPDGTVNVMNVNGGQGAFAPASHFHNIENVGDEDVEVIAFFSNADPDYIGIGEVVGSYSNDLLGSVFDVPPTYFDSFKKPEKPLVIVPV